MGVRTSATFISNSCSLTGSERFWLGLQMDYDLEQARETITTLPRQREEAHVRG